MDLEYVLAIDLEDDDRAWEKEHPVLAQNNCLRYLILKPIQFQAPLAEGQEVYICDYNLGEVARIAHEHDGTKMTTYALFRGDGEIEFLFESATRTKKQLQTAKKLVAGFGTLYTQVDVPYPSSKRAKRNA